MVLEKFPQCLPILAAASQEIAVHVLQCVTNVLTISMDSARTAFTINTIKQETYNDRYQEVVSDIWKWLKMWQDGRGMMGVRVMGWQ